MIEFGSSHLAERAPPPYILGMYNKIHPYALIIGMLAGFAVLLILRHALFALFAGFCGVLLADVVIKRGKNRNLP